MRKKIMVTLLFITIIIGIFSLKVNAVEQTLYQAQTNHYQLATIPEDAFDFGIRVFKIAYLVFLVLCLYLILFGIKKIQSLHHGGFVKNKDLEYCREVPKSVSLELAYASLYYCSHISRKTLKKGIFSAFIIQWANEDHIVITNKENNIFGIDLKDGNFFKKDIEQELYNLLKDAAGDNNIIDTNELQLWTTNHQKELDDWYYHLLKKANGVNLKPIAEYLLGLKKYLLDYSLIDERRHVEVKLWEEYLIYSNVLGITNKIYKEFKTVYPDYNKIGPLSFLDITILPFKAMIIYLFLLIPFGLAIPVSVIITLIYYIFHP